MKRKYNYLEGLASAAVVGLGQILKGESEKGIILLLLFYFALPAVVYLTLMINGYLFLFVLALALLSGIILWGYSFCGALLS